MQQPGFPVRLALCVFAFIVAAPAVAATGQQLFAFCSTCHGARAEGNPAVGAPALAGQHATYLQRQLQNFGAGVRGTHKDDAFGQQMRAANGNVLRDPKAIAALVAYVSALAPTTVRPSSKFDLRNGNNLYQGKCGSCHGVKAEGNEALKSPRLAGLDAAYIKRQFGNFKRGVRGTSASDLPGRQMALMAGATITNDRDLDDVIGYIQSLGANH